MLHLWTSESGRHIMVQLSQTRTLTCLLDDGTMRPVGGRDDDIANSESVASSQQVLQRKRYHGIAES